MFNVKCGSVEPTVKGVQSRARERQPRMSADRISAMYLGREKMVSCWLGRGIKEDESLAGCTMILACNTAESSTNSHAHTKTEC